jgi:Uma2 family endonuclease
MGTGLKTKLDYGDYCAIPPDGKRYELLSGDLHVTPAPSPSHQRVVLRLARVLQDYFGQPAEVFVSPIDVILTEQDVVQPDLVVVSGPAQVSDRGIEGPPLLVVEVLSPTTSAYDRTTKALRYAALGVTHYWIADLPAKRLECYRREASGYQQAASAAGDERFRHPDFPGLDFPISILWR